MRGLRYSPGSVEETLAISALSHRNRIELVKTLAIINAIIYASDKVVSAVIGSGTPDSKKLTNTINQLKNLMNPDLVELESNKLERDKKRLFKEVDKGPIAIRADRSKPPARKMRMR